MKRKNFLLLAAAAALALGPLFLRRRMCVHRSIHIDAAPEEVFKYINDLRNWPLWREWSRDGAHFTYDGPPIGVGARQEFTIQGRNGALRIVASEPPEHVAYQIDLSDKARRVDGSFRLQSAGRGTVLRWTAKWDGDAQPHRRVRDVLSMAMTARRMHASLLSLKKLAEQAGVAMAPNVGGNGG